MATSRVTLVNANGGCDGCGRRASTVEEWYVRTDGGVVETVEMTAKCRRCLNPDQLRTGEVLLLGTGIVALLVGLKKRE